ncbi:dTDP-4-dehydrorhamnose reductase [Thalassotalea psychrophila]|uniref:dTDP-4-dehydrorhamnose reductase n=1 Tax=Thalassotalea psychrophila TaxID=3065647 RepID=A0ABY9TSM4_9GAMM|nr:dTDP-4-dehydrorhamnose reductase [Colwelliaceae bacterium SQ149]
MKIIITGKNGQLGWELLDTQPAGVEVYAFSSQELDITDADEVNATFAKLAPDFVINAAAYTAVDKAETDIEACYLVNKVGVENIAKACKTINAKFVHISTDFVFDGKQNTPYKPEHKTKPIGVYGESKLAGEKSVLELLPSSSIIIRTAWVYSSHGNNFVKTMLRLMRELPKLGIVYDQVGTPTWAKGLARVIWQLIEKDYDELLSVSDFGKVYHWTDAGVTSWYDFAIAIQQQGLTLELLSNEIPVRPIPASAYPTPAQRPSFSVLDKSSLEKLTGIETIHWQKQLNTMLTELL